MKTFPELAEAGYKAFRKAMQVANYEQPQDDLSPPAAWHAMTTQQQTCWVAFAKEVIAQNAAPAFINPDRTIDLFSVRQGVDHAA